MGLQDGKGKGTYNPNLSKSTRLRYASWRNAALKYLKENGPTSDHDLLNLVTNAKGRVFALKPFNCNSVNNLLFRDNRFLKCGTTHRSWGVVWGANPLAEE
tara:strand:- start:275 stop:577 length:303 start_codon:yes stop_codon:yes gene_type:complete